MALRDVDEGETKIIKELGIQAYGMKEIDHYGINNIMDMVMGRQILIIY